MTKPDWLIEAEKKKSIVKHEPRKCCDCLYYGRFVKTTKRRGKGRCDVHECDIHPKCYNTKFSICCEDFTSATV